MKRETDHRVLEVFRTLLGLPEPWRMVEVQIDKRLVKIEVEWPPTVPVMCPECQRACDVYDYHRMQHWKCPDTIRHATRLCCRVPRAECAEHGVKTVKVPWTGERSKVAPKFAAYSMPRLSIALRPSASTDCSEQGWPQIPRIAALFCHAV